MSAVDRNFIAKSGETPPVYVRHVDDYWVGGGTQDECEKHLQRLRSALKEFELDINESKTRILSMKYVFSESWPSEFENELRESLYVDPHMPWDVAQSARRRDPISTFGKIIDRATKDGDDGIIRHAIRIIDDQRLWTANWDVLEHFLAQCAVQFPHSFDYVARVIAWRARTGRELDRSLWVDIARLTVQQSGSLGRDSESVWAIWLLKELGEPLTRDISDTLVRNSGTLVLCYLAHFRKHGMVRDKQLYKKLRDTIDGNPFAGGSWPLSLELTHLNVGDPAWMRALAAAPLRVLHEAKASIINWDARPRVFEEADIGPEGDGPDYALEDYGSDYEDGESEEDLEEDNQNHRPVAPPELPPFPAI
jgi:hypothetical protein